MKTKELLIETNNFLRKFHLIIGVAIIGLLIATVILLVEHNKLQKEIIETGGYKDGKIKCVCSQEAWDNSRLGSQEESILPQINNQYNSQNG